ncbi:ABC transporter substrate-binding protein [Rathayibacter sp. SD072]|uniref:ABC transporter substrate-binding protein n=1 Tax=Rathayibacter sp. SD072 TaxID=2781731 RepID=UPI001A975CF7|nr:extracellular solute-binding protein [Rathayibacter sp. SD072]MBO0984449.1 extracellular solute-binding protein [Rathayibacter sp. SD072]
MSHRPHSAALRAAALSVAAASALALTACGSAGADSGKTQLSFFSWDNEATMTPVIEAFEAENPDIAIEFSNAPPVAEYISTLQTRLAGNNAADVFVIAAENKTNLIEGGFVKDLTDEPFMADMSPYNTETYSSDGKAYGMSTSSWAGGILVNRALLDAAGVTEVPTDWDGFLDVVETVKDTGVVPYYDSATQIPMGLSAMVGSADAEQGGNVDEAIFDGSAQFGDLWNEPLTAWSELLSRGLMSQDVVSLTGDQIVDEFANGRVAMIAAGPWNLPAVREKAPDLDVVFAPFPTLDGAGYWAGAASPGFAINAKTDHEAEAFLSFLGSEEGVRIYQEGTSALTTTGNYTPVVDPALEPNLAGLQAGRFYLPSIAWPREQDALSTEAVAQIQLLAQGQSSPEDVSAALQARLESQD